MSWLDTLDDIRTRDFRTVPDNERDKAARDVINLCSYASAVVSISPIPFSDALLMLPIQSGMVMTVGHIYGRKVTSASAKDLILELGATFSVGFLARQGIKAILPVFGALLTVPAAFAANWSIGRVAMEYFKNPNASEEYLRDVFKRAKAEGTAMFSKDAFEKFRKRNEDSLNQVAKAAGSPVAPETAGAADDEGLEGAPRKKSSPARKGTAKKPLGKRSGAKKPSAGKPVGKKSLDKKPLGKKSSDKKTVSKKATAASSPRRVREPEGSNGSVSEGVPEGTLEAPSLRALVEKELPRRLWARNALARRIQGIVHLEISGDEGGQWTLDFNQPGRWVSPGLQGAPRMALRCKDVDFLGVVTGQTSAQAAVLSGTLKLDPLDLELAGQIGELLA